jgi:hypothetical protein
MHFFLKISKNTWGSEPSKIYNKVQMIKLHVSQMWVECSSHKFWNARVNVLGTRMGGQRGDDNFIQPHIHWPNLCFSCSKEPPFHLYSAQYKILGLKTLYLKWQPNRCEIGAKSVNVKIAYFNPIFMDQIYVLWVLRNHHFICILHNTKYWALKLCSWNDNQIGVKSVRSRWMSKSLISTPYSLTRSMFYEL